MIEAQQIAKKQGKIRFAGVSTHGGQKELLPWLAQKGAFDVVLTAYNFSMDAAMEQAIDAAAKAGMGVVGMKVMAGGFRSLRPDDPPYQRLQREGALLAALKWVINKPGISTTIPSMTDMDQLEENLKAMEHPFSDSDEKLLAAHLEMIRPLYCRMCGRVRRRLPEGPAGGRCAALPDVFGRIRPVCAGTREIPRNVVGIQRGPLRRLHRMHGEMSARRAGIRPDGARTGAVCMRVAGPAGAPVDRGPWRMHRHISIVISRRGGNSPARNASTLPTTSTTTRTEARRDT